MVERRQFVLEYHATVEWLVNGSIVRLLMMNSGKVVLETIEKIGV